MSSSSNDESKRSRRDFLRAVVAATGVAAAASVEAMASPRDENPASSGDSDGSSTSDGYRETEHIRQYYRTAGLSKQPSALGDKSRGDL